ncbi:MAG: tetratricopeptide repeat protein [Flavobacteriales bacterium]|nr:tetratricopeptide repeat protein [Flavobacteriales bacterium]
MKAWLFLIFISLSFLSSAQEEYQHVVDSVLGSVETSKEDTVKIKAYNYLSAYLRNHDQDLATNYAGKAINLAKTAESYLFLTASFDQMAYCKQATGDYQAAQDFYKKSLEIHTRKNNETGIANSLNDVGISYYFMGEYEQALEYFVQSGAKKIVLGDSIGAGRAYNNTGIMYDIAGKPGKSVEYYLKALSIYEEAKREDLMMGTLLNIGIIYTDQKEYDEALKYYLKGIELGERGTDKITLTQAYSNAGIAYDKKEKYDTALVYYVKSLRLSKEIDFKKGIALAYTNIALNNKMRGDFDQALEYFFKALPLKEELGNKSSIAITQIGIGNVYADMGGQETAVEYLKKGLENAQATGYMNYISNAYQGLYKAYGSTEQYKDAFKYQSLFIELKDSLLNEENTKIINELNTKYETEKKDKELALMTKNKEIQEQEIQRKRIIQYATTGGLVLMLLLSGAIFKGYAQKKKANAVLSTKNTKIERQRDEIKEQKKEVTDSINYAKNIQQAILPHDNEIQQALLEHFILFLPKDIVSGDFYWFAKRGDKAFIAACDCTGHGVPGAFVSMIGNNFLNQIIIEKKISDPGEVLSRLNNSIKDVFTKQGAQEAQDGMDMTLCVIDLNTRKMEFAGAYNPIFIVRKGIASSELLKGGLAKAFKEDMAIIGGDRMSIGGSTEMNYAFTTHSLDLSKGDRIYLFSDGYPDQFGGVKGKKFMIKRMKELLVSFQGKGMVDQKEIMVRTMEEWRGATEQVDDILVIGVGV